MLRKAAVKVVDLAQHSVDVTGQEILTGNRVTLRVNLRGGRPGLDPVRAATTVKDIADAL